MADSADLMQKANELERRGIFLGGPKRKFVTAGRRQLEILLTHGLIPDSRLLDVGCGVLRGGWWSINFLRPERYFGIEPNVAMLEAGKEVMVGAELLAEKKPRFSTNAKFNFSVFGERFDFIMARSIWTHASRAQIRTMLVQFRKCSHPRSVLIASIRPPPSGREEDTGADWRGRSHENDSAAMSHYSFATIESMCKELRTTAELLGDTDGQLWVKITHPPSLRARASKALRRRASAALRLMRLRGTPGTPAAPNSGANRRT